MRSFSHWQFVFIDYGFGYLLEYEIHTMKMFNSQSFWVLLTGFSSLILALSIAWVLLAQAQFFYGVWHDIGGIKEGIADYGPKNKYKKGFADTTRSQRIALFSEINQAIHHHGNGLSTIRYQTPTSNGEQYLLREPEVIHLRDVANLIDVMRWVVLLNVIVWLVLVVVTFAARKSYFGLKKQLPPMAVTLAIMVAILCFFSPEVVFNQLHIWVFPDDHAWFFYYQDSLMSTMMLAPVLFGWIAATWLVLAVMFFLGIIHIIHLLQNRLWREQGV